MAHWRDVLPAPIYELQYADLVNNPEEKIRELIAFCDLPWEDACLRFDENERAVRTPSNWQVRQKLYLSSVDRWKNYEQHLAGLIEMLGKDATHPT